MAKPIPWHSRVKVSGMPIAAGAELGIEEAHAPIQKHEVRTTWRGRPKVFGPPDAGLRQITLSCKDRLPPGWEALRARASVLLQSCHFEGTLIPAGTSSVTLRYSPCPDPKKASGYAVIADRTDTNERVPARVSGKNVSIDPIPGVDVIVRYRPIFPCVVVSRDLGTATEIEGRQSWGLTLAVTA